MHLACNHFTKICFSVKELAALELLSFIYVRLRSFTHEY